MPRHLKNMTPGELRDLRRAVSSELADRQRGEPRKPVRDARGHFRKRKPTRIEKQAKKGGAARAAALPASRRSEIAKAAARARWGTTTTTPGSSTPRPDNGGSHAVNSTE